MSMKVKKNWKVLIIIIMILCIVGTGKAEASEGEAKEISILETVWKEEGVSKESRMGVPQTSIGSGSTVSFLDSSGSMFYVSGGTEVSFSIRLNTSASVQMGYIDSNGSKTRKYSGTGSSHSVSFTVPNTGYYRFYVTNQSSSTIQITGGTISF